MSDLGRLHRKCDMCKKIKHQNFYIKYHHGAIIELLPKHMQEPYTICRDCAIREGVVKKKGRR